jgi:hypothetical protein
MHVNGRITQYVTETNARFPTHCLSYSHVTSLAPDIWSKDCGLRATSSHQFTTSTHLLFRDYSSLIDYSLNQVDPYSPQQLRQLNLPPPKHSKRHPKYRPDTMEAHHSLHNLSMPLQKASH